MAIAGRLASWLASYDGYEWCLACGMWAVEDHKKAKKHQGKIDWWVSRPFAEAFAQARFPPPTSATQTYPTILPGQPAPQVPTQPHPTPAAATAPNQPPAWTPHHEESTASASSSGTPSTNPYTIDSST
eukprot:12367979-Heterocapsa_arctica.AAC.1